MRPQSVARNSGHGHGHQCRKHCSRSGSKPIATTPIGRFGLRCYLNVHGVGNEGGYSHLSCKHVSIVPAWIDGDVRFPSFNAHYHLEVLDGGSVASGTSAPADFTWVAAT